MIKGRKITKNEAIGNVVKLDVLYGRCRSLIVLDMFIKQCVIIGMSE